jgi:heme/copper-type cytochrome/quinol oxidase subunit 2
MLLGHKITVASWYLAYSEITVNGNQKHPYIVWFTIISLMVVAVIVNPIIIKIVILVQQIRKQKRENDGSSGKY